MYIQLNVLHCIKILKPIRTKYCEGVYMINEGSTCQTQTIYCTHTVMENTLLSLGLNFCDFCNLKKVCEIKVAQKKGATKIKDAKFS